MPGADGAHLGQHLRRVGEHSPCAQQERLDDEGGNVSGCAGGFQRIECRLWVGGGERNGTHVEQQRGVGAVEHPALANAHRANGVAMIAVFQHQDAMPWLFAIVPVTQCHFQRDFHGG